MWLLQEMQERKKIKKKDRKKKKKPESEADPDPELDAVRADTSEAEVGEPGESSDEAAAQAASPQGSAEHVGPASQEATDAAAAATAGPALAATADGEWSVYYVSLLHGTAVQSLSADSNVVHLHDCSELLRPAQRSKLRVVCVLVARCFVLAIVPDGVSKMQGSEVTNPFFALCSSR